MYFHRSKKDFLQQSINNGPTCLKSIVFSSTSGMTTDDNIPPHDSTSKANLQQKLVLLKASYGNYLTFLEFCS